MSHQRTLSPDTAPSPASPRSGRSPRTPRQQRMDSNGRQRSASNLPYDEEAQEALSQSELRVAELVRENRILARRIEKLETDRKAKSRKADTETALRVQAKQEHFEIQQKMDRMQRSLQARLRSLGIDLTHTTDMRGALDAALAAIQKLSAELNRRDQQMNDLQEENSRLESAVEQRDQNHSKGREAIRKLKQDIEELERLLAEKDAMLAELNEKNHQIEQLNMENSALKETVARLEAQVEEQKQQMTNDYESQIEELRNQLTQKNENIQRLEGDVSRLTMEMEGERNEKESKSARVVELEAEINARETASETQSGVIDELKRKIFEVQGEMNSLADMAKNL